MLFAVTLALPGPVVWAMHVALFCLVSAMTIVIVSARRQYLRRLKRERSWAIRNPGR